MSIGTAIPNSVPNIAHSLLCGPRYPNLDEPAISTTSISPLCSRMAFWGTPMKYGAVPLRTCADCDPPLPPSPLSPPSSPRSCRGTGTSRGQTCTRTATPRCSRTWRCFMRRTSSSSSTRCHQCGAGEAQRRRQRRRQRHTCTRSPTKSAPPPPPTTTPADRSRIRFLGQLWRMNVPTGVSWGENEYIVRRGSLGVLFRISRGDA